MIYLLLTIVCTVLVSFFMRLSEKYIHNQLGMFLANYVVCIVFALFLIRTPNFASFDYRVLPVGIITGILYLVSFLFFKENMKYNGMVLSSTFMKLGVIIPTLMAILIFHEEPKFNQIFGILLSIIAIFLINFEKEAIREGHKKSWLVLLLIINGFADSMANVFEQLSIAVSNDIYLLITFFSSFFITLLVLIIKKQKISKMDVLFGVLIGIPNYLASSFLLLSLSQIEAVIVYPVYSVASIIVVTILGLLFFKEKLSVKKGFALGLILIALILLNV